MTLETAHGLDAALAFGFLALQVGTRLRIDPASGDRDDVQMACPSVSYASGKPGRCD